MPRTVRVEQGSQPSFSGVRVGIMRVGEHHGDLKARLEIRDDTSGKRVDLVEGQSEDLLGVGTLTLEQVHLAGSGRRGEVTLSFRAVDE
ncbi:MAG: hypothetical protein JWN22_570 [Nocardioides sp.]|jgi:hypothetical protein|nr:hypothetical protein [Nocardioides sp.]